MTDEELGALVRPMLRWRGIRDDPGEEFRQVFYPSFGGHTVTDIARRLSDSNIWRFADGMERTDVVGWRPIIDLEDE